MTGAAKLLDVPLRYLDWFLVLAQELHFTKAADHLGVSQSHLSERIRLLEAQVGVELFERTQRKVVLTPAGRTFSHDAEALLTHAKDAVTRARQTAHGQAGLLRVGLLNSAVVAVMRQHVERFRAEHPSVEVAFRAVIPGYGPERALIQGDIDIAYSMSPDRGSELRREVAVQEEYLVALPMGHPLAEHDVISGDMLTGRRMVWFPRASAPALFDSLVHQLNAAGAYPDIEEVGAGGWWLMNLVAMGAGITLTISSHAAQPPANVACRPLVKPTLRSPMYVMARAGETNRIVLDYLDLV